MLSGCGITETPSIVERGDIGSALRSREKTLEYISVSALISHLPNLGIFGEQLTKLPAFRAGVSRGRR
jgi:hypothetical protein